MHIPSLPLTANVSIPALGYGVGTAWFRSSSERVPALKRAVRSALDAGLFHIDEAEMYGNEDATGEALREWLALNPGTRSNLHITSKVISVDDGIGNVCRRSLQALGCEYFDLYLIHAPFQRDGTPFQTPLAEAWKQMEALVDAGLARAIGVSNWRVCDLEQIYEGARHKPCCNQIEAHPYLQQSSLRRWCAERGILLTAYAPLASLTKPELSGGPIDSAVQAAAVAHDKTPAQVLLRWCLQQGYGAITATSKAERLHEYADVFSFELSEAEVAAISEAGAAHPRRTSWTQCAPKFQSDPSLEEPCPLSVL